MTSDTAEAEGKPTQHCRSHVNNVCIRVAVSFRRSSRVAKYVRRSAKLHYQGLVHLDTFGVRLGSVEAVDCGGIILAMYAHGLQPPARSMRFIIWASQLVIP